MTNWINSLEWDEKESCLYNKYIVSNENEPTPVA